MLIAPSTPISFLTVGQLQDVIREVMASTAATVTQPDEDRIGGIEVAIAACNGVYKASQLYKLAKRAKNPLPCSRPAGRLIFSYQACRAWFMQNNAA